MNNLNHDLNLMVKAARAIVIKKYLEQSNSFPMQCVCFTCGNSAAYLNNEGVIVLEIGSSKNAMYEPKIWMSPARIKLHFPTYFDATSGHLTLAMMQDISDFIKSDVDDYFKGRELNTSFAIIRKGRMMLLKAVDQKDSIYLPTGSGETLVILKLMYPALKIHACYNNGKETEYSGMAPLNGMVKILAESVDFNHYF